MMGLRKVRSEATSVRKEGVLRNGTEKVSIIHDLRLLLSVTGEAAGRSFSYMGDSGDGWPGVLLQLLCGRSRCGEAARQGGRERWI